jgi:murein DD-endopeptidase MepM/ murein hydrolase activator NlpD
MDRAALIAAGGIVALGGAVVVISRLSKPRVSDLWPNWSAPIGGLGVVAANGWGDPRDRDRDGIYEGVHEGIDIYTSDGTAVRSVSAGQVMRTQESDSAGLYVVVDHQDGFFSRYLHLSKFLVGVGQWVDRGQTIALSGHTGIVNSSPHLHFDVRAEGPAFDEYRRVFGEPVSGYPSREFGYAVPAEAITPVQYDSSVLAAAAARGVSVWGVS